MLRMGLHGAMGTGNGRCPAWRLPVALSGEQCDLGNAAPSGANVCMYSTYCRWVCAVRCTTPEPKQRAPTHCCGACPAPAQAVNGWFEFLCISRSLTRLAPSKEAPNKCFWPATHASQPYLRRIHERRARAHAPPRAEGGWLCGKFSRTQSYAR
jgi:hypothetical protein